MNSITRKPTYEVLVVDDEKQASEVIQTLLANQGVHVSSAATLSEARASMEASPPHLILLDLSLKEENGLSLLEQIQKAKLPRQTTIAVITGFANREIIAKAISLGAQDVILKPFGAAVFSRRVHRLLKSSSFLAFQFPQPLEASVGFYGQVRELNETSLSLTSPVKIAPGTRIEIDWPLFEQLGCDSTIIKTNDSRVGGVSGSYMSDATFVGISEFSMQRIRNEIKKWQ